MEETSKGAEASQDTETAKVDGCRRDPRFTFWSRKLLLKAHTIRCGSPDAPQPFKQGQRCWRKKISFLFVGILTNYHRSAEIRRVTWTRSIVISLHLLKLSISTVADALPLLRNISSQLRRDLENLPTEMLSVDYKRRSP